MRSVWLLSFSVPAKTVTLKYFKLKLLDNGNIQFYNAMARVQLKRILVLCIFYQLFNVFIETILCPVRYNQVKPTVHYVFPHNCSCSVQNFGLLRKKLRAAFLLQ